MSQTLSATKETVIFLHIDREEVESGSVKGTLGVLKPLIGDRASILSAEGCVSLLFGGYDNDPRPLHSIPEVRSWFAMLTDQWPYWSVFANRTDETTGLIIALLLSGKSVHEGGERYAWWFDLDGIRPMLNRLFSGQNYLVDTFEIGSQRNAQITNDFIEAVTASID